MQSQSVVYTRSFRLCKRGHYRLCNTSSMSPHPCSFGFQSGFAREQRKPLLRQFRPHSCFSTLCTCSWQSLIVNAQNQMPSLLNPRLFVDCPDFSASVWTFTPSGHGFAVCLCVGVIPYIILILFPEQSGFSLAFLIWLLQWVIILKSKPDGIQWWYYKWKIWSVVRGHKLFCLVSKLRASTFLGFLPICFQTLIMCLKQRYWNYT